MLVPHVFGAVSPIKSRENTCLRNKWDEMSFFAELSAKHPDCVDPAKKILDWAIRHDKLSRVRWGEGAELGSFVPVLEAGGIPHQLFAIYTNGVLEAYFANYKFKPPFDSLEMRKELLVRLNQITGVSLPEDALNKQPGIPLAIFNDLDALCGVINTFDWVIDEIRNHYG
jgi:hypothetical protein